MVLATVYQVVMFNMVIPNRAIRWQRISVDQIQQFDEQGRRFVVLAILADDIPPEGQPLAIFEESRVQQELNLLRLTPFVLAISPGNEQQQKWFKEQGLKKLPGLQLFVQGRKEPILIELTDVTPDTLADQFNDLRFQRFD